MFQALIAIVYRALSSGHRDRTSVAAGITIVDFQKDHANNKWTYIMKNIVYILVLSLYWYILR